MVIDSSRRGASDRADRLSYFRISGMEWLFAASAVLACSMAVVVSVGLFNLAEVPARLASPLLMTLAAIGLLASGRQVRGRHRRRSLPDSIELSAWRWAGMGLLVLAGAGWLQTASDVELWAGLPEVGEVHSISVVGFALVAWGTALIPSLATNHHMRIGALADAMAGSVALGVLAWELVVGDTAAAGGSGVTSVLLVLAMSAALGAAIFTELQGRRYRSYVAFRWFVTGLAGLVSIEMLRLSGHPAGLASTVADPIELASAAAILVTVIAMRRPRVQMRGTMPAANRAIAYVPVAALLALAVHRLVVNPTDTALVAAGVVAVAVLFGVAQAAASREERVLVETERDRMVASVAHELRTPLTAVAGFSDLLATQWVELDDTQRLEMVRAIQDQSGALVGMVSDMVSLVGDRLHSVELDIRQVDAKSLIAGVVRSMFGSGSVTVRTRIEPYLEVMCDRGRLEQVIELLLDNARRYGAGQILIDGHRQGAWRVVEIHDDGPGLTETEEEIVWDRFRRGSGDRNAGVPGAGLGLSKARALARAHAGDVTYRRSDELGGACFAIRLPLDRNAVAPSTPVPVPSTFPPRVDRIHSVLPGPVHGRIGPSPALSRRQSLPYSRMSTGGNA